MSVLDMAYTPLQDTVYYMRLGKLDLAFNTCLNDSNIIQSMSASCRAAYAVPWREWYYSQFGKKGNPSNKALTELAGAEFKEGGMFWDTDNVHYELLYSLLGLYLFLKPVKSSVGYSRELVLTEILKKNSKLATQCIAGIITYMAYDK